jgi:signal transduction histidine kinase
VFENITDELLRAGNPSEESYRLLKEVGLTSCIIAPMFDGKEPLGQLTLASVGEGGRRYSPRDIDFAFSLAGRAALAVRNARLVRQIATERDHQRLAREESDGRAAQLLAVFRADPNGLALFDASGHLALASERLDSLVGVPVSQRIGMHFVPLFEELIARNLAEPVRAEVRARIGQIFADQPGLTRDDVEVWPGGAHRWLRRQTAPVRSASGGYQGRLFVYVDITAERELDQQRADFMTVAAHELRTPLTPLSIYLESIERRLSRGEQFDPTLVSKALRQTARLGRLVEDLLDVSRMESGRLKLDRKPLRLDELVAAIVADFRATAPAHQLVLEQPSAPVLVDGDRARLEQVLVNLLANAIKYSPSGGEVTVTVGAVGSEACVAVTDHGIGIAEEDLPRVFQRFFRGKNADPEHFGGLGIGLFVSDQVVREHGGYFEVISKPGEGTTLAFLLPLASDNGPA